MYAGPSQVAPEIEPERFGLLLRRYRIAAGLSQERLAEAARISTEAVSALERGTRKAPQRQTLALLIDALALGAGDREALTLAAVRPSLPRLRAPRADQPAASFLLTAPSALTSFVGRDADVAAVLALCRSARLTSIVGTGGVGKSRLALEAARRADGFADGVAVAALAPILPHAPVLPTIAAALGIRDEGAAGLDTLIRAAIGSKSILLILDNCEHVLDEVAVAVHALLAHCPGLSVLATSRARLRVDGERLYRLRPLSIEHAVDVFIDRASANGFDPAASEDDLTIAAEICDRLDRVPLAIELAASSSNVLAFDAILTRLRENFALPATPNRSALPRHRSLQALVEWSYDRLEPGDAVVFRHLAPFVGGCRLDDAQEIIGGDALSTDDVLYALFRLHEQSLIDADRATIPRFGMLQTIRDFATTQLAGEERAALTRRFARHYFALVSGSDLALRSAGQNAALDRIAAEASNLRAAFALVGPDDEPATEALAALGTLSHYWLRTGTLTEGAELYAATNLLDAAPSHALAGALCGAAFVEINRRVLPRAQSYALRARQVAQAIDDPWYRIYAAIAEHTIAALSADFTVDEPFAHYYDRAVELGDAWLIGTAAYRMAQSAEAADDAARLRYLEIALENAQASGDAFAIQSIQLALGRTFVECDPRRAASYIAAVWAQLDRPSLHTRRLHCAECFADIAMALDRPDDAAAIAGIGLAFLRETGAPDAARAHLTALVRRLAPERGAIVARNEHVPPAEASERIASFVRSVTHAG
jgi:predicted ATPase/transcriptional regulator with XRE-family HTH domain